MPSFNFQKRFAELVEFGSKNTTIRPKRRNAPREDQTALLFTGLRTKNTRRLGASPIVDVSHIEISTAGNIDVDGQMLSVKQSEELACADGFESLTELVEWFDENYDLPFHGDLITWAPLHITQRAA